MKKKYFFGWTNFKWLVNQVRNLYSDKSSYFSKKRVESSIAFLVGQWGMIYFLINNVDSMGTNEIISWSAIEFVMAGYTVAQIQKEKKNTPDEG